MVQRGAKRQGLARLAGKQLAQEDAATRIHRVVSAIPPGKVATYGQVALLAGIPAGHRIAARAMRECPEALPWYRVLAKKDARRAKIALADPEHAKLQARRLRAEGVRFDEDGYTALRQFGWLPVEASSRARRTLPTSPAPARSPASQKRAIGARSAARPRKSR